MTIRQIQVASNANLDFAQLPQLGLNGTYTEVFMDKPVALQFAQHALDLKCKVETARLGGKFYVSWTGKYLDRAAWTKQRLAQKAPK